MFHSSTQSPEQPVFIFQFRNLKKSTISLSHVITRLFNLLANYPMQRNRALSRHGLSESGYFTTNVNSAGIRIDGWNSNTANGFSNSIATRNPPLPASGTAIVFSIRFGRLVLSFYHPRFILHRAGDFDNSCCVKHVVEHIAFRLSVYRIFGR